MRNLEQHITQYAAYHRDRRNIVSHFIGVPMIVFSVVLALVPWTIGGVNAALIALALASIYYLILDRGLGTAMLLFLFVCYLMSIYLNAAVTARRKIQSSAHRQNGWQYCGGRGDRPRIG